MMSNNGSSSGNNNSGNNTSQEEPLKRMGKLVNYLMAKPDAGPFLEPVDWRGLELFDYPKIIEKMMDLGTVKRKLERHQYATAHECAQDIRLIWKNCLGYQLCILEAPTRNHSMGTVYSNLYLCQPAFGLQRFSRYMTGLVMFDRCSAGLGVRIGLSSSE